MRNLFASLAAVAFSLLVAPTLVLAQSPSPEPALPVVEVPPVVEPTFAADSQVDLAEAYNGPVFAVGGQVNFSGSTTEDLVVAGGTIRVSGRVEQDVYAAGGSILIEGEVQGNVIAAGGEVQLLPTAQVGGSVIAAGERLWIESAIARSSWLSGSTIFLSSVIQGDLNVFGDELTLKETASISGDLQATVDQEELRDEAQVAGERNIQSHEAAAPEGALSEVFEFLYSIAWRVVFLGAALLLFPSLVMRTAQHVKDSPVKSAVSGMIWLAAIPLLALLLLVTAIGAPLAAFVVALYVAVILVSWIFPTMTIGHLLLPGKSKWLQGGAAILVLSLLGLIPVVGTLVQIILVVLGVGALWANAKESRSSAASGRTKAKQK